MSSVPFLRDLSPALNARFAKSCLTGNPAAGTNCTYGRVAALGLLITLQYLVTFASVRSSVTAETTHSEATLLLRKSSFYEEAMHKQRVTHQAQPALRNFEAVVLESDGSLRVNPSTGAQSGTRTSRHFLAAIGATPRQLSAGSSDGITY